MFDPTEDIEDLYRRAADRFDLESSGPDWEKISRTLDKLSIPAAHSPSAWSGGLRKLITGSGRFIPAGIAAVVVIAGITLLVSKMAAHKPGTAGSPRATGVAGAAGATGMTAAANAAGAAGTAGTAGAATAAGSAGAMGAAGAANAAGAAGTAGTTTAANAAFSTGSTPGATRTGAAQRPGSAQTLGQATGLTQAKGSAQTAGARRTGETQTASGAEEPTLQDIPLTTNTDLPLTLWQVRMSTDRLQLNGRLKPIVQATSAGTGPVVSPLRQAGRFSAGVSGALDLSFVEGQSLSQPGSSGGILAGMQVTRRINLETGIYISHKIYYTAGKHMPKVPLPYGVKLLNARAHTSLVEIPLTLRYSILGLRSGTLYAGAGGATYLVNSEMYNYQAEWQGHKKEGQWAPRGKIPQHLISALTANLGYRWNVGKTDMLRTELYGKLPVSGLGKASIPVTSAGIALSFLHSF